MEEVITNYVNLSTTQNIHVPDISYCMVKISLKPRKKTSNPHLGDEVTKNN